MSDRHGGNLRVWLIQALFLSLLVAAGIWWFSAPGWEPVVTGLAGLIGLLSFRSESTAVWVETRGDTATKSEVGPSTFVPRRSVAVLPFENRSDDPETDYFAEGVSDDIIAQLAKVRDLKVISRTSVQRYKDTGSDLSMIGRELKVGAVLEGSVRRAGNRVRIVVQLTDTETATHLWAERYDREITDILSIQADVADCVARALDAELGNVPPYPAAEARKVSPEVYRLHLLGRHHANKWSREGWEKAVGHLEEAIRLDGGYGPARATLAYSRGIRAYMGLLPPREAFRQAEEEARAALALDETDTEAHMALGLVFYWLHWEWADALAELRRAVETSPGNSTAQSLLGVVLDTLGRHSAALTCRRLAYELDPLSPIAAFNLGYGFMIARQFPAAIDQFKKALDLDPHNAAATYGLGMSQLDGGDAAAACRTFQHGLEEVDSSSTMLGFLGWAKGAAGLEAEARGILKQLLEEGKTTYVSTYHLALVYLGLADLDNFFNWLSRAYHERHPWMVWFHITPSLDKVRADSRFMEIARSMNLPLVGSGSHA